jgi:hypothetical protein
MALCSSRARPLRCIGAAKARGPAFIPRGRFFTPNEALALSAAGNLHPLGLTVFAKVRLCDPVEPGPWSQPPVPF